MRELFPASVSSPSFYATDAHLIADIHPFTLIIKFWHNQEICGGSDRLLMAEGTEDRME